MKMTRRMKFTLAVTAIRRTFVASVLVCLVASLTPVSAQAAGCCEIAQKGKKPCTEASCISACYPLPKFEDCMKDSPAQAQWKEVPCGTLEECTGKAPQGCCIGKDRCFAGTSATQCAYFDNAPYSAAPCNASVNSGRCAGKIDDETFIANSTPTPTGTQGSFGTDFTAPPLVTPSLSVQIPNVSFSQLTVQDSGGKKFIDVPYLAQYIQGIYNYILGIVAALAIAFVVWGGVKWLTASGDSSRVTSARTTITNALVGLVLALGSWFILNTINPSLVSLTPIRVELIPRNVFSLNSYMAGNSDAPGTLTEVGIQPGNTAQYPTNLTIPSGACPGRNKSYKGDGDIIIPGIKRPVPKSWYTIQCGNEGITDALIAKYMVEQAKTGVPAGALMANIMSEAGPCAVIRAFSGGPSSLNHNYGGIGCSEAEIPKEICPNVAFNHGEWGSPTLGNSKGPSFPLTGCRTFNGYRQACVDLCEAGPPTDYTTYNCGNPKCFPMKSHASTLIGTGTDKKEIWIPSIQCSKKFDSTEAFLASHLGFAKYCLPYNDSIYKFAYCIGASTYAGPTGSKAIVLAQIIERNCLCDPATDSTGCNRNTELEQKLAANVVKKRNLYNGYGYGKSIDYAKIVADLAASTGGLLTDEPAIADPSNDLAVPGENAPY